MKDIFNRAFWRKRVEGLPEMKYTIGKFDFEKCDPIHTAIIDELIPNKAKVLDKGCGYGRASGFFVNYTGIDFLNEFIDAAREKYPDEKFMLGDMRSLPFRANEFDWGVMISIKGIVEGNTNDWPRVLREAKRCCKKVLILEYNDPGYEIL